MRNFLSTPKLILKNTILIKRRKDDFTTNIFLPQRDINILQFQKECVYMDLQHFLVNYFVLLCCWVVSFFSIFCVWNLYCFFLIFFLFFCVWFFLQISINNLKLLKEMDLKQEKILFKTRPSNTVSVKVQFVLFVQFLKCRSCKLQKMSIRAFGQLPTPSLLDIGYSH